MMGLKLLTSNAQKYASMMDILSHLGIELHVEDLELVEIQTRDISQSANAKALDAARLMSAPVLIDDVALYLDAYNDYPGPLIKHTLKGIGYDGIKALLRDKDNAATIVCALSVAIGLDLFCYQGRVKGYIDLDVEIEDESMMLSSIFKCENGEPLRMKHRELAFESLSRQLLYLRAKYATHSIESGNTSEKCDLKSADYCRFCQEFDDIDSSVFTHLGGDKLQNRIVYEDDDFILLVPIGLFVEGGLLLLPKEHIPSFAHLPKGKHSALNDLIDKIKLALFNLWGVEPIIFEHGHAIYKTKGKCCVDHAHFNIFPVSVNVHSKLEDRFPQSIKDTSFLCHYKNLEDGYIYVDSPISGMYIYDGNNVPSQLLRRYITEMLGIPDRWHWRYYMGIDEMKTTLDKLRHFK